MGRRAFQQQAPGEQHKQREATKGLEAAMPSGGAGTSLGCAKSGPAVQNMLGHKLQKHTLDGEEVCVCAVPVCAGTHEGQPQLQFLKPCPPCFEAGSITGLELTK